MFIKNTIETRIKRLVNKKHNITKNILETFDEEKLQIVFDESTKLLEENDKEIITK